MRETRADNTQALFYSIALHAILFAIAFIGLWWTRSSAPVSAAGPVIEAELIDPNALSASMRRTLRKRPEAVPAYAEPPPAEQAQEEAAPPPQPEPEPVPQDSPVEPQFQAQERVPEPDTREQERVSREAIAKETREREQEEKRRQEQIDLTEERERQQEAERKQRLSQMQLERLKQLEDIRRQRAVAARDAKLAEAKLKQLADARARNASEAAAEADAEASASPPPGNNGVDNNLLARYQAALQEAIARNWTRPETVPLGQRCKLVIRQIPGGEVIDVEVVAPCPYDDLGKRSIEAAVLKAQPLPYAGFETVFNRQLNLTFTAQDR